MRLSILALLAATAAAADFPNATITNGEIEAKLYLPNFELGSYRGTRFDWSGIIYSLTYRGHQFTYKWYERHDPKIHDAVTGPAEEFLSGDTALGYEQVAGKPGGTFIRIGVGEVLRPKDEKTYQRFKTYDIVNPGKWTVRPMDDRVEFEQTLRTGTGYSYVYQKTVRLEHGKPQLVLEHTLRNIGKLPIDTDQYDHNFWVIDNEVVGPQVSFTFGFDVKPVKPLGEAAQFDGRKLVYTRELQKGQSVAGDLTGFGASARDYDIHLEYAGSHAGVRFQGDRPLTRLYFWSIRTVACAEPYIHLHIEPGKDIHWVIRYTFDAEKR